MTMLSECNENLRNDSEKPLRLDDSMQDKYTQCVNLAHGVLEELRDVAENGLHPVYEDFNNSLPDLWADLPWDYHGSRIAQRWIVWHPEFYNIAMKILDNHGVNMLTFFGGSINFIDEELAKE